MLKSKDAFVPCRNKRLVGNRLSLTAMEKVAAFSLCAGFMPNSPMPMLDVCDCPLLTTVSTTVGGFTMPPWGLCKLLLLWWLGCLVIFIDIVVVLAPLMVVGVEKWCCIFCDHVGVEVLLFWISILLYVLCTIVCIEELACASLPWFKKLMDDGLTCKWRMQCSQKLCGCWQQQHMRTVVISPLLLPSSPKWLQHPLHW